MPDESFKNFVLDQLGSLGITVRAMFGGHGLYRGADFFGILHKGQLYFRTNDASRAGYIEHGMGPFRPNAKQTLTTYYEVPPDILEDNEALAVWAKQALAARAAPAARAKPKPRKPPGTAG